MPDTLNTGIIRLDQSGIIQDINTAAVTALGLRDQARRGQSVSQLRLPDLLGRWIRHVQTSNRPMHIAEAVFSDAPQLETMDVHIQPHAGGVLLEMISVAQRIRQRELQEQADRRQALTRLLNTLAHELRNPLGGMRGAAQLIEQQSGDAAIIRHARLISDQIDRITILIEQFTTEHDEPTESTNVHRLLNEAADLVLAESGFLLNLHYDFDPSIPDVEVQPQSLYQLFLNLLRNATQADADQLRMITRFEQDSPLLTDRRRHAMRIDIEDNGVGVPDNMRERLFLPMVSGRPGGTGFGLAVAQQIARRHGGLIEYRPLPAGSLFRVRIPMQPPERTTNP